MARDRSQRVLLRPATPPRRHHQNRQPPRPPAPDRSGMVLPTPAPAARPRSPKTPARLAGRDPLAPPLQASHLAGETPNHRDGRDRPRAHWVPLGRHHQPTRPPGGSRLTEALDAGGQATAAARRRNLDQNYAIPTRDQSARQLTTGHCPAVPTRASQSDSRRCRRDGRPAPSTPTTMTNNTNQPTALDTRVHLSSTRSGTTSGGVHLSKALTVSGGRCCSASQSSTAAHAAGAVKVHQLGDCQSDPRARRLAMCSPPQKDPGLCFDRRLGSRVAHTTHRSGWRERTL